MYKYNDKVKIVKGFYKGYEGLLVGISVDDQNIAPEYRTYEVEIYDWEVDGGGFLKSVVMNPDYFEKINWGETGRKNG